MESLYTVFWPGSVPFTTSTEHRPWSIADRTWYRLYQAMEILHAFISTRLRYRSDAITEWSMKCCRTTSAPFVSDVENPQCCTPYQMPLFLSRNENRLWYIRSKLGTACPKQWKTSMRCFPPSAELFASNNENRSCCIVDQIQHSL